MVTTTGTSAYGYTPNLPVAVVATVIFGVVAVYHAFLFVQRKTFFFWAMLLAAFMEVSGCGLRAFTTVHPEEARKYLISYLLLILAPSILTLSLFALFDRLLWYTTPPFKRRFSTTWVPASGLIQKLFKVAYFIAFIIQWAGGATLISSYADATSTEPISQEVLISAERLLKAGFMIQAVCTGIFGVIVLHFLLVSRGFTPSSLLTSEVPAKSWKALLGTTAIVTMLLILRTVYRIFEFSAESLAIKDFVRRHEFTFWACDAVPMLMVLVLLALTHPGQCMPEAYTKFWFRKRKIQKMEKKVLETQTWPSRSGSGDLERAEMDVLPQQNGGMPWPVKAYLPMRH